jgi:hypothetical protein
MGNNTYILVLGQGTAIFALNGKRVLICNALHVPGLAVPLYILHTHLKQQGCSFPGTNKMGFLVYIPTFILSVDMAVNPVSLLGDWRPWRLFITSNHSTL